MRRKLGCSLFGDFFQAGGKETAADLKDAREKWEMIVMKSVKTTAAELIAAGYLLEVNMETAQTVLTSYHAAAADAQAAKTFTVEDKAHQAQVISDAEGLAEADLEMGQIEDRFVQAEVIESAVSLAEKDDALFERADALIVAACTEAAAALEVAGLVDSNDLEAVTRLIARLWKTDQEEDGP